MHKPPACVSCVALAMMILSTVVAGKRRNVDVLDGYSFLYPEDWAAVTVNIL